MPNAFALFKLNLENSFDVCPKPLDTVEARTIRWLLKRVEVKFDELEVCWIQVCSVSIKNQFRAAAAGRSSAGKLPWKISIARE